MPRRDRTLLKFQTFRCQMLLQCMTLLLRDARLVEDAAKRCISAQPASGKRKCAACNLCGTRFTQSEARLQQWTSRETNHHYVHAHCVNGGLGHFHELFPKQATDQDAVDAVTRQRGTITRTAADTEVLLPFAQDPDQASTAAPPDDERDFFGREEALRMDEEIMDFQWFEQVTWDSIKDLRGTTYVQPPTRFKFALQQAQHAILRAIIHNNPTSSASESAWKALVLSSWLLLGRPAWYVLNVMLLQCRTRRAGQRSSKSSHVFAKLLHWPVLVKKEELWRLPETRHRFQSLNKLFRKSRAFILRTQSHRHQRQLQSEPCSCLKLLSRSLLRSEKCPDSVNQDLSACVLNTGTILALWQETVTCLCK